MRNNVLVLQVYTTVDLELVESELAALLKAINRPCHWVKEHRLQSFVITTWETSLQLSSRLEPQLVERPGIGGAYCFTAPEDLVGNYGELEALRFQIDKARLEARQRDRAKNMHHSKRRPFRKRPA